MIYETYRSQDRQQELFNRALPNFEPWEFTTTAWPATSSAW